VGTPTGRSVADRTDAELNCLRSRGGSGPYTATESPRRVTTWEDTSPCPTWNWIATGGIAPAHVGSSVSRATRVATPGFSSSTSSSTSREPSRFSRATVIRRRVTRTGGPVELVSYTERGRRLELDRPGVIGSEK